MLNILANFPPIPSHHFSLCRVTISFVGVVLRALTNTPGSHMPWLHQSTRAPKVNVPWPGSKVGIVSLKNQTVLEEERVQSKRQDISPLYHLESLTTWRPLRENRPSNFFRYPNRCYPCWLTPTAMAKSTYFDLKELFPSPTYCLGNKERRGVKLSTLQGIFLFKIGNDEC